MAKLDASQRKSLPSSDFAGKDRSYPIPDRSHAIQALRMKSHASPAEQKQIVSKVKKKFPGVGDTNPIYK
jgi:hypothetical protein